MGPVFHFLGRQPRDDHPRRVVRLRARLPDDRRAADQPAPGHPPRGLRRRRHLRHEQRVRLRLPARQHGHRSSTSGSSASARFAIVDEVDNILIDEARTPLIISGQAEESARPVLHVRPPRAHAQGAGPRAPRRAATTSSTSRTRPSRPTEEGVDKIEKLLGVENLYDADPRLARHFEQALRAHALYKRDRDYIVKDGEIVIVDEFTGRQMPGRRWSEGLHQAIEAKEGPARPARERDARHDHLPELLPALRQARRHDRHGDDRGRGVPQDLQARGRRHPDPPRR